MLDDGDDVDLDDSICEGIDVGDWDVEIVGIDDIIIEGLDVGSDVDECDVIDVGD